MNVLPSAARFRNVGPRFQRVLRILPALMLSALIMAQTSVRDSNGRTSETVLNKPKAHPSNQQRKADNKRKSERKSENKRDATSNTKHQDGKQSNAAAASSSGETGPQAGRATLTESPAPSRPVAANPGPPMPPQSLSRLRQGMEMAKAMAASADRSLADYNKCGTDFLALGEPAQAASPKLISNLEAYSAGFSKLRDVLLLQQAALEREADGQSLGRRLIMQDEAVDFKAAARKVAEEIIALGQERDAVAGILAAHSKAPDWKELGAACKKLQTAAEADSNKWSHLIEGLRADIRSEEYRIDAEGETRRATSTAPATDTLGGTARGVEPRASDKRGRMVGKWESGQGPLSGVDRVYFSVEFAGQANYEAELKIMLNRGGSCKLAFRRATEDESELNIEGGYLYEFSGKAGTVPRETPMDKDFRIIAHLDGDGKLRWQLKGSVPQQTPKECLTALKQFPELHRDIPARPETEFSCAGISGRWRWEQRTSESEKSESFLEISIDGDHVNGKYWQRKSKQLMGAWEDGIWTQPLAAESSCNSSNKNVLLNMPGNSFLLSGGGTPIHSVLLVLVTNSIASRRLPDFKLVLPQQQQESGFHRTSDLAPH